MPRICLSVALITIFTVIGVLCSLNLKKRCSELSLIVAMLDEISVIIRFKGSRLSEIISELKRNKLYGDCSFMKCLSEKSENGQDISEAWLAACDNALYVDENDRKILRLIGSKLGETDTDGQLSMLGYNTALLKENLNGAEKNRAEKSKVFMSVSALSGIGLGIIIL